MCQVLFVRVALSTQQPKESHSSAVKHCTRACTRTSETMAPMETRVAPLHSSYVASCPQVRESPLFTASQELYTDGLTREVTIIGPCTVPKGTHPTNGVVELQVPIIHRYTQSPFSSMCCQVGRHTHAHCQLYQRQALLETGTSPMHLRWYLLH